VHREVCRCWLRPLKGLARVRIKKKKKKKEAKRNKDLVGRSGFPGYDTPCQILCCQARGRGKKRGERKTTTEDEEKMPQVFQGGMRGNRWVAGRKKGKKPGRPTRFLTCLIQEKKARLQPPLTGTDGRKKRKKR